MLADPARRTTSGRSWRIDEASPPWEFVIGLLRDRLGCVKGPPGLSRSRIPEWAATTWVSHRGDLVETTLWSGPWPAGSRIAVLLPDGAQLAAEADCRPPIGPPGRFLYDPDPAVIRAGAIGVLARTLNAWAADHGIAYLFAEAGVPTAFATTYQVLQVLPMDERRLRAWVRESGVGALEIKVRGLDLDPATLRRRLRPQGSASATLVLTPTVSGARALVVRRC